MGALYYEKSTHSSGAHTNIFATTKSLQSCPTLCDPIPGILNILRGAQNGEVKGTGSSGGEGA